LSAKLCRYECGGRVALKALYDMRVPIASGLARIKKANVHPFAVYRRDSATVVNTSIILLRLRSPSMLWECTVVSSKEKSCQRQSNLV
jgi:hypothetical protein